MPRLLDEAAAHAVAGRLAEAAKLYERAERAAPNDFRPAASLATIDVQLGRPERALPRLRRVTRLAPGLFDAWGNLGAIAQTLELWDEAASAYERALALRDEAIEPRRNLAIILAMLGRTAEAAQQHRRLAEHPATRLWALTRLALLAPAEIADEDLAAMQAAAESPDTDPDARIGLAFALGEALERRGRDEAAFAAFAAGNRLKHDQLDAGPPATRPAAVLAAHRRAAEAVRAVFTPDFVARHAGEGVASIAPIFIVGMPRSGSTLIEQILGAHPRVQALGESAVLPRLLEAGAAQAGAEPDFRGLARRALKGWRERRWRDDLRAVDKTLENYLYVGAIALMFPRAVILHSVRDPVDTCLSCYRQLFVHGGETLYDLEGIAAEYAGYRRMMAHWAKVLPGRVIDVGHEALVTDPQSRIRWLVTEACGLAWDDACLAFHAARTPVRTASSAQVRQPIFTTSLQRWRRYEAQLEPLLRALDEASLPPHSGVG
ncbi:MAG TPA: sulfotransferase [Caulobacteraceae bacterium]|nr:sulfotransferase [Caulobacteraceae bacterium]